LKRFEADEELRAFFEDADTEKLRRTQTNFLCAAAGGPETYDAEPVLKAVESLRL
jgi:hemoglobin